MAKTPKSGNGTRSIRSNKELAAIAALIRRYMRKYKKSKFEISFLLHEIQGQK